MMCAGDPLSILLCMSLENGRQRKCFLTMHCFRLQVSSCLAFRVSGVGQCVEQADMLDVPYGVKQFMLQYTSKIRVKSRGHQLHLSKGQNFANRGVWTF